MSGAAAERGRGPPSFAGPRACDTSPGMRQLSILLTILLVGSCASETRLPGPVQAAISARHIGKTVELRQSMYYGDLYDENEMWLLSPYPFAETYHIVDPNGAPIHPQGQQGMFPAGSRFVVQRVEFPNVAAMARRMLTSPRYNPWVYLTPAAGTIAPTGRKFFILVLPMDLDTDAAVESALASVLAPNGEVASWLASIRPTARAAIENKDIVPGMTLDEVTAAMGPPQRLLSDTTAGGAHVTVAWYPSREAWILDGQVAEVRPGRKLDLAAPAPAAATTTSTTSAPVPAAATTTASPAPAAATAAPDAAGTATPAAPAATPAPGAPASGKATPPPRRKAKQK